MHPIPQSLRHQYCTIRFVVRLGDWAEANGEYIDSVERLVAALEAKGYPPARIEHGRGGWCPQNKTETRVLTLWQVLDSPVRRPRVSSTPVKSCGAVWAMPFRITGSTAGFEAPPGSFCRTRGLSRPASRKAEDDSTALQSASVSTIRTLSIRKLSDRTKTSSRPNSTVNQFSNSGRGLERQRPVWRGVSLGAGSLFLPARLVCAASRRFIRRHDNSQGRRSAQAN
jgi:hypothetical protein